MEIKPGIKLIAETEGIGQSVGKGDLVRVRLNGWLNQGDVIQENLIVEIEVGKRVVIPGIEYSLEGMKPGGKRKVRISPHLGYKDTGAENLIPPNAVLVYEIEILELKKRTADLRFDPEHRQIMIALSGKWGPKLVAQSETGMGYQIASIMLKDGRQFDRVVIVGGIIAKIKDVEGIPFSEDQIDEIIVTHDKWDFSKKPK